LAREEEGMRWSREKPAPRSWAVRGAPYRHAILKGHTGRFLLLSSRTMSTFWTLIDEEEGTSTFLYARGWEHAKLVAALRIEKVLRREAERAA
jgi:hypothetical protein